MLHRDRNFAHETIQTGQTDWVSSDPNIADILSTGSNVNQWQIAYQGDGNDNN